MSSKIYNLVKGIAGVGVLSLSTGAIGAVAAYNFSLLEHLCAITGTSSYLGAWEESVRASTAWIPGASCVFKTFLAILTYSMVLGDTISSLFNTVGMTVSQEAALVGPTVTVLLPLCLLKDLSSLAPFSTAGNLGSASCDGEYMVAMHGGLAGDGSAGNEEEEKTMDGVNVGSSWQRDESRYLRGMLRYVPIFEADDLDAWFEQRARYFWPRDGDTTRS